MSSHGPGDPRRPSPARPPAGPPSRAPSWSVLVVGEDPAFRGLLARTLRRGGAAVDTAAAGRDALFMIADGRARPSVLLTDIEMPGMSGIELAARVAVLRPGIRIVMMTGDPDRAAEARRHRDLVHAVLLKPMSPADLLEATTASGDAGGTATSAPGGVASSPESEDTPPGVEARSGS